MFPRISSTALCAAAVIMAACSGKDSTNVTGPNGGTARVRFVNAISDTSGLNLTVGDTGAFSAVRFGSTTTGGSYVTVPAGNDSLYIRAAGNNSLVTSLAHNLTAGGDYTVVLSGSAAAPNVLVLSDTNTAPASGNAAFRFVNAAYGNPNMDVYVTAPGVSDLTGQTATVSNFAYGSGSTYYDFAPGAYRVRFANTGTTTAGIDVNTLPALTAGQIRTIVALPPAPGQTSLGYVMLNDRL